MVDFTTPYAMNDTVIPAEGLRRQQQDVSGAGSGVVRAGDLKILPLTQPGRGVRIMPGHDLIQCRSSGRDRETYGVQLNAAGVYMGDGGDGIPGTGSTGGRRDMIIHEILDPDLDRHFTPQENWPAGATSKLSVVQNVPAGAKRVEDVPELNLVTCYELAAINWPVNTTTISGAMIEDLRQVQSPFSLFTPLELSLTGAEGTQPITATSAAPDGGKVWPSQLDGPSAAWSNVLIPEQATHVVCRMTWNGVRVPAGLASGWLWVQMGMTVNPDKRMTQPVRWDTPDSSAAQRVPVRATGTLFIPPSMRGTRQSFYPRANRTHGTNATAMYLDSSSSVDLDLFFVQRAV